MTFSELAALKQSASRNLTETMSKEFNSSDPGVFSTTRRKRSGQKGRNKKLVTLCQAPIGISVLNSNQKHVPTKETSSENISRKFKNDDNHTEIIAPGSKFNDKISTLNTSIENHHRVSETNLCMTFSEPAAFKHSISAAVAGMMSEEFNSS